MRVTVQKVGVCSKSVCGSVLCCGLCVWHCAAKRTSYGRRGTCSDLDRDGWRTEIRHEVADAQYLSRATAQTRAEHMLIVL